MSVAAASHSKPPKRLLNRVHDSMFSLIHSRALIYNTCWEDPRLDRRMLNLDSSSRVLMITSAGCNALDYLLDDPAEIHAVDVNPRQNALLQLKLALFSHGKHEELWKTFGEGVRPDFHRLLEILKPFLDAQALDFWEKKHHYFEGGPRRSTFYYRGAAGYVAWAALEGLERTSPGGRKLLETLINAQSLEDQTLAYHKLQTKFWNSFNRWLVRQSFTMALLGVPRPQINLIQNQYPGGLGSYIRDKMEHTLTQLPISENYFWRAYALGKYSPQCCPNYLKPEHFQTLRQRIDRLHSHTMTVSDFLRANPSRFSHFVLLDHQDWLASHNPAALQEEWDLILAHSLPGARILMRSASSRIEYIPANILPRIRLLDSAASMHQLDRVGTYGCTFLAEVL